MAEIRSTLCMASWASAPAPKTSATAMYFVVKSVSDIVFKYNCLLKTGKIKDAAIKLRLFMLCTVKLAQ